MYTNCLRCGELLGGVFAFVTVNGVEGGMHTNLLADCKNEHEREQAKLRRQMQFLWPWPKAQQFMRKEVVQHAGQD